MSTIEISGSPDGAATSASAPVIAGRTPRQLAWARLKRDKLALASIVFIVFIVLVAIFALQLSHLIGESPNTLDTGPHGRNLSNGLPLGPSTYHWFGTDNLGRDILSRTMFGARISLEVGLAATALEVLIGLGIGLVAGFYGGRVDNLLSRFMDIVLSFPFLITALVLVARYGAHLGIVIAVITFFGWAGLGRVVRGQTIALREREFVEAARSLGSSDLRIMFIDILPNLVTPIIVYGTLLIPLNIVSEATLSFLGLGVQPPTASWGNMLNDASTYYAQAWWFLVFPALALLLTTLAFNLLGDGLRDALDPRADRVLIKN